MANRKYRFFIFHGDGDSYQTSNWQRVFISYAKNESATIYGMPNYDGAQLEVIMSK